MKRLALLALLLCLLLPTLALALDTTTRLVSPVRAWSEADLATFDPAWLHVKFVEGSAVRLDAGAGRLVSERGANLSAVNAQLASARTLRSTFDIDPARGAALKAAGEAASGQVGPDLSLWFDVEVAGGRAALAEMLGALNADPAVEIAHPAPICEPAVIMGAAAAGAGTRGAGSLSGDRLPTPDYSGMQTYLYDPPVGLDAPAAWATPGGHGAGMHFVDVELGWTLDHEDFNTANFFFQGGAPIDPGYIDHGTAVLGEIIGMHNSYGVKGFADETTWGVEAITVAEWPNVPHRFLDAVNHLSAGDVWLIELQMYPSGYSATPMEYVQANYDVIWTSSWSLGIVCVEAGANGTQDLDAAHWGGIFDRNLRDSGAIMVGAGTPTGRVAEWFTNWGSRMDVHAWGSSIVTTGYGDLYSAGGPRFYYTSTFGGTSGASPMITGSSLCLQGIARAHMGVPMTPAALRGLLHDTGIAHLDPTKEIGPRPDLGAAIAQFLNGTGVAETPFGGLRITGLPNPFREGTELRFVQPRVGEAQLAIYDATGRLARRLALGEGPAGERRLAWDGRDADGRELPSGVYLFHLAAGGEEQRGRLVKLR